MLKKLFISLLILTTLSSEGIINFPVNIYNFYMCTGSSADYSSGNAAAAGELQAVKSYNSLRLIGALGASFSLTLNSLQMFKAKSIFDAGNNGDNFYYSLISIKTTAFSFQNNKYDILHMSDNSPPKLNTISL